MQNKEPQRETVLFVNDEKSYLAYTSDLFENRGLNILTASSAMEALQIVEHQSVAVVVSDNEMPGMRGILRDRVLRQASVVKKKAIEKAR